MSSPSILCSDAASSRRALVATAPPLRFVLLASLAVVGCACTHVVREADLFQPNGVGAPAPADARVDVTAAADGTALGALSLGDTAAPMHLLYFTGNGECAVASAPRLRLLAAALGVETTCLDYRGYGLSGGAPSLAAALDDAARFYDRLAADHRPVAIYGRSLGSGIAVWLAAHRPAAALALEAPPADIPGVVDGWNHDLLSWWQRWFVTLSADRPLRARELQPATWIAEVRCPLLIIHGAADRLIPPRNGRALADAARATSPTLLLLPGRGHNDIDLSDARILAALRALVANLGAR